MLKFRCEFDVEVKNWMLEVWSVKFETELLKVSSWFEVWLQIWRISLNLKFVVEVQQSCSYLHTSSLAIMQTDIETLMKEVDQLKAQNKVLQSILTKIGQLETEVLKLRSVDGESLEVDNFCADGPIQECDFINFKCDQCDFRSKTQKGVNIHKGSKHKEDASTVMLPLKQVVPGSAISSIRPKRPLA